MYLFFILLKCKMKRLVFLFLLFQYLMVVTPFGEMLKLPLLISHYKEHNSVTNIGVLHFLADHYLNHTNHKQTQQPKDDDKTNQGLPFKSIVFHSNLSGYNFQSLGHLSFVVPNSGEAPALPSEYKDINYTSSYLGRIWQPPRTIV